MQKASDRPLRNKPCAVAAFAAACRPDGAVQCLILPSSAAGAGQSTAAGVWQCAAPRSGRAIPQVSCCAGMHATSSSILNLAGKHGKDKAAALQSLRVPIDVHSAACDCLASWVQTGPHHATLHTGAPCNPRPPWMPAAKTTCSCTLHAVLCFCQMQLHSSHSATHTAALF